MTVPVMTSPIFKCQVKAIFTVKNYATITRYARGIHGQQRAPNLGVISNAGLQTAGMSNLEPVEEV